MKINITVDKEELQKVIAGYMRWIALENEGVMYWPLYHDALSNGLGDYLAEDGDYFTPYDVIAEAIVKEIQKCQQQRVMKIPRS